jgi:hypothetical protein
MAHLAPTVGPPLRPHTSRRKTKMQNTLSEGYLKTCGLDHVDRHGSGLLRAGVRPGPNNTTREKVKLIVLLL